MKVELTISESDAESPRSPVGPSLESELRRPPSLLPNGPDTEVCFVLARYYDIKTVEVENKSMVMLALRALHARKRRASTENGEKFEPISLVKFQIPNNPRF